MAAWPVCAAPSAASASLVAVTLPAKATIFLISAKAMAAKTLALCATTSAFLSCLTMARRWTVSASSEAPANAAIRLSNSAGRCCVVSVVATGTSTPAVSASKPTTLPGAEEEGDGKQVKVEGSATEEACTATASEATRGQELGAAACRKEWHGRMRDEMDERV